MYKNIERNKEICWNQPKIIGKRLTVYDVVCGIYNNGLLDYIEDFEITMQDAIEASNYCEALECQKDLTGNFCHGCILNSLKNGRKINKEDFEEIEIDEETFTKHGDNLFLGSFEEYKDEFFGVVGWRIAEIVKAKYNL